MVGEIGAEVLKSLQVLVERLFWVLQDNVNLLFLILVAHEAEKNFSKNFFFRLGQMVTLPDGR